MARNVPKQSEKISADCPHCGFSQLESAYAKSTFCRKCGEHYSIEKLLNKELGSVKGPSLFDKLSKLVSGEKIRKIQCFSCAHPQEVSSSAQSSLCPNCGSYIDLRDIRIAGPFGRSIQTQGEVHITSRGDVSNARVACGTALIEGKLRGSLVCTGIARFKLKGTVAGAVDVNQLVIEKRSNAEFSRPVKARSVEINGRVSATLMCETCVTIHKGGSFEGTIHARAMNIEKGGIFSGELFIGQKAPEQTDLRAPLPEPMESRETKEPTKPKHR